MPDPNPRLTIALLAVPESTASTLHGMYDLFASVGRDWGVLMGGVPGEPRIAPVIVSRDGKPFEAANGIPVHPGATLAEVASPDVICVPDLAVAPGESIRGRYEPEIAWMRHRYDAGAALATACTGALLLAEGGLLDGRDATTHWAYCEALVRDYPSIRVHPARALIATGEGQRILMAGGGTSWLDLALAVIGRFVGIEEAMRAARLHLIDWHEVGQQPFAVLTTRRQTGDAVIAQCQEWAAVHYDSDAPVAAMAQLSGLAERSFKRRFRAATGMAPMEYVHNLRIEEAKQMLETTDDPVEAVAGEVGYEDASFFGRLFKRRVGLTPAQYRRRFGALRRNLRAAEAPAAGATAARRSA